MIIVQIEGGLGNQMFQYALSLSFVDKGCKVKLDISKFGNDYLHNGYELEKVFDLKADYCTKKERAIIKPASKFLHVLTGYPYKEKQQWQWVYHPKVNKIKFGFLKGYWQSEKYFETVAATIKKKFLFPPVTGVENVAVVKKMMQCNSVSVHIRRGDYMLNGNNCALNLDYYLRAISMMNEKVINPVYFIFSDDIAWAEENIRVDKSYFIGWNNGERSYMDMQLMSNCRHNIIANSSFSWWGAWLNKYAEKIVMAPQRWMPELDEATDVLPKEWILIPSYFAVKDKN